MLLTSTTRWAYTIKQQGWAILAAEPQDDPPSFAFNHTRHNNLLEEHREHPSKLSAKDLHRVNRFLQDQGWDARVLTWDQLALACEVDLDVVSETLRAYMGSIDYHKYIACTKG